MVSLKLRGPRRPASNGTGRAARSRASTESKRLEEREDEDMDDSISVHRPPSPVPTSEVSAPCSIRSASHQPKSSSASVATDRVVVGDPKPSTGIIQDPASPISLPVVPSINKGLRKRTLAEANDEMPLLHTSRPLSSQANITAHKVEQSGDLEMTGNVDIVFNDTKTQRNDNMQDDLVEEYDFSNEPEENESDYDDDGRDTEVYKRKRNEPNNIITISSDDEMEERWPPWDTRPWNQMDNETRHIWEMMYCEVTHKTIGGDWNWTEDFQAEKDKEMLRYLEDFPVSRWVIPKPMAAAAQERLEKRLRWRKLGIPIFDQERRAGFYPPTRSFHSYTESYVPPMHQQPNGSAPFNHQAPQVPPYNVPPEPPNGFVPSQPATDPRHPPYAGQQGAPSISQAANPTSVVLPNGRTRHSGTRASAPTTGAASAVQKGKRNSRASMPSVPHGEPTVSRALPPPPPYPVREMPEEREAFNKSRRKPAQARGFPWNRPMDFTTARSRATWDDSVYKQETLQSMLATRKHNEPIIQRIDDEEAERLRQSRAVRDAARSESTPLEASSDAETKKGKGRRKSSVLGNVESGTSDSYHSGHYTFATLEDEVRAAKAFGPNQSPDDIMHAAEQGKIVDFERCKDMMITWNPGKRSMTQDLQQARFSIKDALLTREQLDRTPILTRRAAECIVDFCPDKLWRGTLLRIVSEAGYGNKDVRDRMCLNGNYCDKATMTKRIGSALGQKQAQSTKSRKKDKEDQAQSAENTGKIKAKPYAIGEEDYYNQNVIDFSRYTDFFGHRVNHRMQLSLRKHKATPVGSEDTGNDSSDTEGLQPVKNGSGGSAQSPAIISSDPPAAVLNNTDKVLDVVCVQSDTILDEMEDDD